MGTMHDYFDIRIAELSGAPGDDVLSLLARSGLSKQERISFARLMLVAGNETTANLINNALRLLVDHPDQQTILREEPGLVDQAVEEVLRFWPSIRCTFREVRAKATVGGVTVDKGDIVWPWLMSANHDEELCRRACEFDIRRQPVRHVAFGFGIHTCLGNALARLEAKIMLETLLRYTRSIERLSDELEPIDSIISNGVRHQYLALLPA